MDLTIRAVDDGEFVRFHATESAVFAEPTPSPEGLESERTVMPLDRTVAAFDGDEIVGTAADYPFDMTLPGGATLPVAGVTAVTVRPTHRRRGVLTAMMAHQLDAVAERGEPMAILNASDSRIYGRFGYGLAELFQSYEIEPRRSAFAQPVPPRSQPMRMLTKAEARTELPPVYDRCRILRPGMLSQSDAWWGCVLGDRKQWKGGGDLYVTIADADEATGTGPGFVIYRIDPTGGFGWRLQVFVLAAADPVVEAQLWRYLLDVDLVGVVEVEGRPLDCNLRWWLADPRAVKVTGVRDFLWVRLLDIERSLSARAYPVDDQLALGIRDPFRPTNDGTYLLDGAKATCVRTASEPDLDLGVDDVGAMYLGQARPSALAGAGRIVERTPGALARADALLAWPVAPECVTRF